MRWNTELNFNPYNSSIVGVTDLCLSTNNPHFFLYILLFNICNASTCNEMMNKIAIDMTLHSHTKMLRISND